MSNHLFTSAQAEMRSYIQRVATGPELSKDLSRDEARCGMTRILAGEADPVQAAIYLIALRMKRESPEEETGVLEALLSVVHAVDVDVDDLVDIADPYDGFVRGTPASTFLAPVLAALGVPTAITGAESVGPKYGVTHHMVLHSLGIDVHADPSSCARRLADPAVGWAYIDQAQCCPALHALSALRTQMVKRTVITTLEVLLRPLRARRTHLMTGYVHKPYPPRYTRLARHAGYASAMIVRGVEGGVVPSLSQPSKLVRFDAGATDVEVRLSPEQCGIEQALRMAPLPPDAEQREPEGQPFASINAAAVADEAARLGVDALQGRHGVFRDSLVYGASICLVHLGRSVDMAQAAKAVRAVLDDGSAHERLQAARR